MNCIENLKEYTENACEPCYWNAQIIEFEQLPEKEKYNFDYYDKDKDFLIYCKKCEVYKLIPSD
jgi:hypothetical protein